ncbi:MAG TPA: metallophosphoesterase, partial [Paracoccaceae bacterium]|nr:metallophosphoesterase [Paracoccaceae bacterium]
MTLYAIGDIHGQFDRLRAAHDLIAADAARHGPGPVVHLGDLVDRGPDSAGVVAYLMAGIAAGADWVVIVGNHDRMFRLFVGPAPREDPRLRPDLSWLHPRLGGAATLASYGVRSPADRPGAAVHAEAVAAVPPEHLAFLSALPLWHRAS